MVLPSINILGSSGKYVEEKVNSKIERNKFSIFCPIPSRSTLGKSLCSFCHRAYNSFSLRITCGNPRGGVDFLGWVHFANHRVLRTATKKKMFRNIDAKTEDKREKTIASYLGMLKWGNGYKLAKQIEIV